MSERGKVERAFSIYLGIFGVLIFDIIKLLKKKQEK